MRSIKTGFVALTVLLSSMFLSETRAEDPDFLTLSTGVFDPFDDYTTWQAGLEYRSDYKFLHLKPMGGIMMNGDGGGAVHAGVLMDIYFGRRVVVTPSFAPSIYWRGGDDGKDLGIPLEFRSGIEFAYRFDDRSRLGVSIHHYSNAGISDRNPGVETISLNYSMPFGDITGLFD